MLLKEVDRVLDRQTCLLIKQTVELMLLLTKNPTSLRLLST